MSEPGELQAAKAELQKKRSILRGANERHDKLLESSSPDPQEVLEAKVGVAEAKVGVAETELGVAKAKLGVAEAKEETPERQTEIAKAEMGVAKAEWDVAIAVYNSEAKTSNSEKLEILQGRINDRKETYNDSRETYKRLEGQLSSLYFRAPPGSTRTSRSYLVSSLLFIALPRNSVVCSRTCLIVAMNSQTCLTLLLQLMHCIYACTCIRQHT
jgi:hypothetical protein